jgi:hypothetical protein
MTFESLLTQYIYIAFEGMVAFLKTKKETYKENLRLYKIALEQVLRERRQQKL